jgi:hypothetical protein
LPTPRSTSIFGNRRAGSASLLAAALCRRCRTAVALRQRCRLPLR